MNILDAIRHAERNDGLVTQDEFLSIYEAIEENASGYTYEAGVPITAYLEREINYAHFRNPAEKDLFLRGVASQYWSNFSRVTDSFFSRFRERLGELSVRARYQLLDELSGRSIETSHFTLQLGETHFRRQDSCSGGSSSPSLPGFGSSAGGIAAGLVLSALSSGRGGGSCESPDTPNMRAFFSSVLSVYPDATLSSQGIDIVLQGSNGQRARLEHVDLANIRNEIQNSLREHPRRVLSPHLALNLSAGGVLSGYDPAIGFFSSNADLTLSLGGRIYQDPLDRSALTANRLYLLAGYQLLYRSQDPLPTHVLRAGFGYSMEGHDSFQEGHSVGGLMVGLVAMLGFGAENIYGLLAQVRLDWRPARWFSMGPTVEVGGGSQGFLAGISLTTSFRFSELFR